ncbi:MAG: hypothetical protein AAF384_19675 [Pseudomonadota bacterium]
MSAVIRRDDTPAIESASKKLIQFLEDEALHHSALFDSNRLEVDQSLATMFRECANQFKRLDEALDWYTTRAMLIRAYEGGNEALGHDASEAIAELEEDGFQRALKAFRGES